MGHRVGGADRAHVTLQRVEDARPALRRDEPRRRERVHVDVLVAEAVGDLFPADHEEALVEPVQRVQRLDAREDVVVGEHEEGVAALLVPLRHVVRVRVAVAVERVRVRVPLVPAEPRLRVPAARVAQGERRDGDDTNEHDGDETAGHGRSGTWDARNLPPLGARFKSARFRARIDCAKFPR